MISVKLTSTWMSEPRFPCRSPKVSQCLSPIVHFGPISFLGKRCIPTQPSTWCKRKHGLLDQATFFQYRMVQFWCSHVYCKYYQQCTGVTTQLLLQLHSPTHSSCHALCVLICPTVALLWDISQFFNTCFGHSFKDKPFHCFLIYPCHQQGSLQQENQCYSLNQSMVIMSWLICVFKFACIHIFSIKQYLIRWSNGLQLQNKIIILSSNVALQEVMRRIWFKRKLSEKLWLRWLFLYAAWGVAWSSADTEYILLP